MNTNVTPQNIYISALIFFSTAAKIQDLLRQIFRYWISILDEFALEQNKMLEKP